MLSVSCSTHGKPISCHDPVSGHGEFLSRKRRSFRTAPCADAPQVMCSRTQVQILAMFSSLRGISWPSRIQQALSICKVANLDLVRGTASTEHCNRRAPRKLILRASRQGLLRSDCNPHARTSYYTFNFLIFALPVMCLCNVLVFRGLLWGARPAPLFVWPKLKGHAFFDNPQRLNTLCVDVHAPITACHAAWPRL